MTDGSSIAIGNIGTSSVRTGFTHSPYAAYCFILIPWKIMCALASAMVPPVLWLVRYGYVGFTEWNNTAGNHY